MDTATPSYRGHRFPPEIISHAVWLYYRFCLSFRDVEDLLAEREVIVSYETIRQGTVKLRARRPAPPQDMGTDVSVIRIM